jgi:hypothetical protein
MSTSSTSDRGGRLVSYNPVQVAQLGRPIPGEVSSQVDKYVTDVNTKMAQAVGEMESRVVGRNDLLWGWVAGGATAVLLLGGHLFARRWKRRRLEATQKALIAETEAGYALELREFPEMLDLNQPAAIHRLITVLEQSGSAPKPLLPTPLHLVHRVLAPF